jgi:hypothetical protein
MSTQEHFSAYFEVLGLLTGVQYWQELAVKIEMGTVKCRRESDEDKDALAIDRSRRIEDSGD